MHMPFCLFCREAAKIRTIMKKQNIMWSIISVSALPLIKMFGEALSGVRKLISIMSCFRADLPDITGIIGKAKIYYIYTLNILMWIVGKILANMLENWEKCEKFV